MLLKMAAQNLENPNFSSQDEAKRHVLVAFHGLGLGSQRNPICKTVNTFNMAAFSKWSSFSNTLFVYIYILYILIFYL